MHVPVPVVPFVALKIQTPSPLVPPELQAILVVYEEHTPLSIHLVPSETHNKPLV